MKPGAIVVVGAGGHGKVVADIARTAGFDVIAFLDDAPSRAGTDFQGVPVFSTDAWIAGELHRSRLAALGIGDNAARMRVARRLRGAGIDLPTLVHPRATTAASARLGAGTVMMAHAVVNPDAIVGEGVILNTGAIVEHDCRIGDFAHLSPNATLGGTVTIGEQTHLGLGAVVLPGVTVGDSVRVGAGTVILRNVRSGVTVVGVPARIVG